MSATPTQAAKVGADKIILGLLAVLVLCAVFYALSQRQQALRSSPTGLDGLQLWLSHNGQDSQSFSGGWPLDTENIGLQIIPLYDTNLVDRRRPPKTKEELIQQQDEYDLERAKIRSKSAMVPTLIVLPKWRSGMRLTGLAHPFLLSNGELIQQTGRDLIDGSSNMRVGRARQPFTTFEFRAKNGTIYETLIYAAQTLNSSNCLPIIGTQEAMLLGWCHLIKTNGKTRVFVLSDPDLINNHGLMLGENAFVMRDWVAQVAGERRVIIDYSRENWLSNGASRVQRDRTWADLRRFFSPPFTLMWAGLALVVGLTLWRAAVRFGPLLTGVTGIGASKMVAIAARAKLMRLSNRDGALAREYCQARLAATAAHLFGPAHARRFARPEAFVTYIKRCHPRHATALTSALNQIETLPDSATAAHALATVAALDGILERIRHDT
ncbi:hypothetical protein [Roseobacter weihaiensis]|uniref:hypothetical protein n=1 Tax=Roseobacter weihaiensis TaxID=2763262 RepID=UPI001D0AA88B|nr:hypothetical protein [Roseobacter sp. H9]